MHYRLQTGKLLILSVILIALSGCAGKYKPAESTANLSVTFGDSKWDGKMIPKGQQCKRFGGDAETPSLVVENIPSNANAVIIAFSDRSYQPMDNGGHGKIGFSIPKNTNKITIPSVKGHTFDLPENFFVVSAHANPSWDVAGAYMPPCSGGQGNSYYATLKAVYDAPNGEQSELLGKGKIELGKY